MNLRLVAAVLVALVTYDLVKFLLRRAHLPRWDWEPIENVLIFLLAPLAYIGFAGNAVMRRVWYVASR